MMTHSNPSPNQPAQLPAEPPVKLPLDFRTLLIGVRSRVHVLGIVAAVSLLLAFVGALMFGHKEYETSTVLLYKAPAGAGPESDGNEAPSLLTQLDMVKIPANLEETRRRLKLKRSVEKLGSAIKVEVPINSSLMEITVKWDDPRQAADIANTVREVFLDNQLKIQHSQAGNKVQDLNARLEKVQTELRKAEQDLKDFTVRNHVVDTDKEAGWYLQQLINTELVYEQARGDERAAELQQANIGKFMDELKQKVRSEEEQMLSDPARLSPNPADKSAAAEDIRGRVASLKMKELEMQRAKTLADEGIYSHSEYERAKASFEAEKFALYNNSPSAALLREMTLKELSVKLNNISDQQKVLHLKGAVDRVREKLDSLPLVQREYLALQREVAIRAAERERIDQFMGLARRQNESESYGFSLVSAAKSPLLPVSSNRKLVFFALAFLGMFLGLLVVVALELLDRRVHSVGDARAKLKLEVLAGFRHGAFDSGSSPDESLTLMSRLRTQGLKPGSRILVVSPTAGEGAPEVATQLARSFANGGGSALLVDAQFRDLPLPRHDAAATNAFVARLAPAVAVLQPRIARPRLVEHEQSLSERAGLDNAPGFSDLLAGDAATTAPAVSLSPRVRLLPVGRDAQPELLLSPRVNDVLHAAALPTDVVFVHAAPLLHHPDARFLGPAVPAAILVAAAGKVSAARIERCAAALAEAGITVLGIVVTNIADVFVAEHAA